MHHITSDKRIVQSAKLIGDGFRQLMLEKDYDKITITEIASHAGVGRSTFYRLFDDKSDIVLYEIEILLQTLVTDLPELKMALGIERILYLLLSTFLVNRELLKALIEANIYEKVQQDISSILEKKYSFLADTIPLDKREWKYFVFVRISIIFSALRLAIIEYPDDTTESILITLNHLFNDQQNIMTSRENDSYEPF